MLRPWKAAVRIDDLDGSQWQLHERFGIAFYGQTEYGGRALRGKNRLVCRWLIAFLMLFRMTFPANRK